jgi:hypothetical protein
MCESSRDDPELAFDLCGTVAFRFKLAEGRPARLDRRRGDPPPARLLLRGVELSTLRSIGDGPVNLSSPLGKSPLKNCR